MSSKNSDGDNVSTDNSPRGKDFQKRKLLFEYPALPRYEIAFYFAVLIGTLIYAWSRIFVASVNYKWNSYGIWDSYEDVVWPFGFGVYRKDTSNEEWGLWSIYARMTLPFLIGHSILFNAGELILPNRMWRAVMLAYWLYVHFLLAGRFVIAAALGIGFAVYCLARLTRSKALTWLIGMGLLYWSTATTLFVTYDTTGFGYYIPVIIFPYKMLQYLTYITEMIPTYEKNDRDKTAEAKKDDQGEIAEAKKQYKWPDTFLAGLYKMFWYSFYLPYSSHMIVTYKRFPSQLASRSTESKRRWKQILVYGLRILFWYALAELCLYVFYFEAMMENSEFLKTVTEDTLVSIGYAVGQFFHLKYVVIFGLVSFFAQIDKMQPFQGPICITRVALYSKMWRCFDRGLYDFFKEYIFLPICRPTFSIPRKLFGVLVSYSFVLIWHGTSHQYLIWIILNISELMLETVTKVLYSISAVKNFREKYISDRNLCRILAWFQIIPFAFGLYSNFYFLGNSDSGYVFVDRIFWQETVPVKWPFLLLISIGYCFSHVCMEVDRWHSTKMKPTEESKKKE